MLDSSHVTMNALDSLVLRASQARDASVAGDVEEDLQLSEDPNPEPVPPPVLHATPPQVQIDPPARETIHQRGSRSYAVRDLTGDYEADLQHGTDPNPAPVPPPALHAAPPPVTNQRAREPN